ncbi:MAG: hypothetical protein M3O70_01625, partial [Actinomycetota bacterium]|nr:hypothetical protein [Actinomycetota bacterium]
MRLVWKKRAHPAMRAVIAHDTPLVDDHGRLDGVRAVGLDQSSFLNAARWAPTRFVTSFVVSLDRRQRRSNSARRRVHGHVHQRHGVGEPPRDVPSDQFGVGLLELVSGPVGPGRFEVDVDQQPLATR